MQPMTPQEAVKILAEAGTGNISPVLHFLPDPRGVGQSFLRLLSGDPQAISALIPATKHPIVVLALQGVLMDSRHAPAVRGYAARVMVRGLGEIGMKWLLNQALNNLVPPDIAGGEVGVCWQQWTPAVFELAAKAVERHPDASILLVAGVMLYAQANPAYKKRAEAALARVSASTLQAVSGSFLALNKPS